MCAFILKRKDLERMLETKILDIIADLPHIIAVEEDMPVEFFIDSVKKRKIDAAVVISKRGRVSGIVTRLDLLKLLQLELPYRLRILSLPLKTKTEKITIKEIMTPNPISLSETAKVKDAIELMSKFRISHIVIVSKEGKPRAIISRRYVLRKIFGIEE